MSACGYEAIRPAPNNKIEIDREKCTTCLACVEVCPKHALYTEGRYYTVEQLMTEVMKDQVFYEGSGGGVTLSGGEALAQGEFAIAFLKALKNADVHTVVETSGYVDVDVFKKAVEYIDLLYFDVKHYDDKKHVEKTDVSHQLILHNLKYAAGMKKDIVARIPMIPGFNDSLVDSQKYAELLTEYGVSTVHLLPFHQYGSGKYDLLGLEYEYKNVKNTREEALRENMEIFKRYGFKVQIGG
jgi:pyruvate formate lyase activating enzyme